MKIEFDGDSTVLLPDEVISQYRHERKLEKLFNTVIVMIKATVPVVFHHLRQSFPSKLST